MYFLSTDKTPAATVNLNGHDLLFFSGFAYLGLHMHPVFKEIVKEGIDRYGTVFMSSRVANVQLSLFDKLEEKLAGDLHQPAAVTFSSGYMASQATIHYAADKGELLYAPDTHPSLWYGQPQIPALSWREWADQTIEKVNASPDHTFVIVAAGVNPLTSTVNDFSWLTATSRRVLVVIDNSHGIGTGRIDVFPDHDQLDYLICASLAKAYSLQGGFIAGGADHIREIRKQPIFTAGTSIMPANAYAFLQSATLHEEQKILLHQRIAHFRILSGDLPGIHNPFLLPVFVLQNSAGVETYLSDHGVIISSFAYPSPDSAPINRIVVSAHHTNEQLEVLYKLLKNRTVQ